MSFDEADEIKYLGYSTLGGGGSKKRGGQEPQKKKTVRLLVDDDDDDDDNPRRPIQRKKKPLEQDDNDDDPIAAGLFTDASLTIARKRAPSNQTMVPYRVQAAADEILNSEMEINSAARTSLTALLNRKDEFTIIDPLVVLDHVLDTGTCKIHLKEAIPFSQYAMARVLGATYFVQITPKIKTQPETFEPVKVKMFRDSNTDRAQPFGVEAAVNARLEDMEVSEMENFLLQTKAYMFSLGPVSSLEAADLDFIETQLEAFKKILSGELVPLVKRHKKNETEKTRRGGANDFY